MSKRFWWLMSGLVGSIFWLAACGTAGPAEEMAREGSDGPAAGGVEVITSATVLPPTPTLLDLPDLGPAPDFTANDVWLNSDSPLTLADVRGKVVLVEFWTFG